MQDNLKEEEIRRLIRQALAAREKAYAPYSRYLVGAALLCRDGEIVTGCNIENAAYTPSNCAERTAFFRAVSSGRKDFRAIAVTGGKADSVRLDLSYPCGVCRQVMEEFCDAGSFLVITARSETDYIVCTLAELLPHGFGSSNVL